MSTQIAEYFAKITADTTQIQSSLDALNKKMVNTKNETEKATPPFDKLKTSWGNLAGAAGLVTGVGVGLVAFMQNASNQAAEAAKSQAKLEAVLKSTGGAVGLTVDALGDLANELERVNAIDADLVTDAQAVLLTFTKIGGEVFPSTMQAAIDMSAVLGGDLQGAVVQVGKAMNDFSGYTALKRAGVSFTEEQIKQIEQFKETNDLVGYQNLLLNELQTEFGGAAKAMADAGNGSERLAIAWGNFMEEIGDSDWWKDVIRGVTFTIEATTNWIDEIEQVNTKLKTTQQLYKEFTGQEAPNSKFADPEAVENFERFTDQLERGRMMTEYYSQQVQDSTPIIEENAMAITEQASAFGLTSDAIDEALGGYEGLHGLMGDFQGIADTYIEKMDDLKAKEAELLAQKQTLIAQGYGEESTVIGDINAKLDENIAKQQEAAAQAEEAAKRRIVAMVETGLMADQQLTGEELNALLALETGWGLMSQEAATSAQNVYSAVQNYLQTGDIDDFTRSVETAAYSLTTLPEEKVVKVDFILTANGQTMTPEQMESIFNGMQ